MAMLNYQTPGVYLEQANPPRPLQAMRMDVAAFVGLASTGPLHTPVKVESWTEFTLRFGEHIPQSYLAYAVEGFFANGGQTCYVVRAADPAFARRADLALVSPGGGHKVRLTGKWKGVLQAAVMFTGDGRLTLSFWRSDGHREVWRNLSMHPQDGRYVAGVLGDDLTGSLMVSAQDAQPAEWPADLDQLRLGEQWVISSGDDGLQSLEPAHLTGAGAPAGQRWGLAALERVDEVNFVAIPDLMFKPYAESPSVPLRRRCQDLHSLDIPPPPQAEQLEYPPQFSAPQTAAMQQALIDHCHRLKDRMALLDSRFEDTSPDDVSNWRSRFVSKYSALYYPWLLAPDPLELDGLLRPVPPSGHVAGIYARLSAVQRRGQHHAAPTAPYRPMAGALIPAVHLPPANAELYGVQDVRLQVADVEHGRLNRQGINVIRSTNGRGIRVAGARTLVPRTSEYRYVNVRRLLLLVSEVLDEQLQWTVFEANNEALWRDADRVVRSFLRQMWENGMLDGATAGDAFSVTCDQTTNTAYEVENGRLVCQIELNLPWPAEFVVVRLGKTEGGVELMELGT